MTSQLIGEMGLRLRKGCLDSMMRKAFFDPRRKTCIGVVTYLPKHIDQCLRRDKEKVFVSKSIRGEINPFEA